MHACALTHENLTGPRGTYYRLKTNFAPPSFWSL